MEENKKKIKWEIIVIVVMAFLTLFCLAKINELSDENDRLNNEVSNFDNRINALQNEINSIYNNVDEQLKKEASLLSGVNYTMGNLNADNSSVSLELSVVPKVITEGMMLRVSVGDKTVELVKNGNSFVGTIDVGLFIEYDKYPLLTIETEDGTKTEYLENVDVSYLFYQYLPALYAEGGSNKYSNGKLSVDLNFIVESKHKDPNITFTKFTLIEEVNGTEVSSKDVTAQIMQSDMDYTTQFSQTFEVAKGEELKVYLVAEDSLGYIHKILAHSWYQNNNGSIAETVYGGESIYDKNGNLLYGEKE